MPIQRATFLLVMALAQVACTPALDQNPPWPAECDLTMSPASRVPTTAGMELGQIRDGGFVPLKTGDTVEVSHSSFAGSGFSQWVIFPAVRIPTMDATVPSPCVNGLVDLRDEAAGRIGYLATLESDGMHYVSGSLPIAVSRELTTGAFDLKISAVVLLTPPSADLDREVTLGVTLVNKEGFLSDF